LPSQPVPDAEIVSAARFAWPLSHADRRQLQAWETDGIDRAATVIPVIRRVAAERANSSDPPSTLRYFDRAVRTEHAEDQKQREYYQEIHERYGPKSASGGGGQ
jgi:hypothetical protein